MKISNHSYYIQPGNQFNHESMAIANAMAIELINYGYCVSPDLLSAIASTDKTVAMQFCSDVLKDYTVGELNPPLFNNWEQRTEFTIPEIIVQILGYMIQLSGNDLENPTYLPELLAKINFTEYTTIQLALIDDAKQLFKSLVMSKVGLDRAQLKVLSQLAHCFHSDLTNRIQSDEARIAVLLAIAPSIGLYNALIQLKCKPADVLRYAAGLTDITAVNLPSDVKYAPLNWSQRVNLLKYLNQFEYEKLFEDTGVNREAWTRFYHHVHVFGQKDFITRFSVIGLVSRISMGYKFESFPKQYVAITKSMIANELIELTPVGNLVYRTFASRIQSAIEARDIDKIESLLENNGGYLLRNLATVANAVDKAHEIRFINLVRSKLSKASANQLFSILGINVDAEYRVIDIKGNTVVEPANYPSIIRDIQGDITRELRARYGLPGVVTVSESLRQSVVPFLSRNSELSRGTRVKLSNDNFLYMFVHWVQPQYGRTDLDLSVMAFDENWQSTVMYFGNQANQFSVHSGDITNAPAPNGATEYVRIDLNNIPSNLRYILPIINVYAGAPLSLNAVAYAGFHCSNSPKFSIKQNHTRYDLTAPANSNIPFMYDVQNRELVIIDFNNRVRSGLTAHSEIETVKNLISATNDKNVMTIGALADILSGDDQVVSLNITESAIETFDIEPAALSTLFSEI